jgi:hypothetical protein
MAKPCKTCRGVVLDEREAELVKTALQQLAMSHKTMPGSAERALRLLERVWGWRPTRGI